MDGVIARAGSLTDQKITVAIFGVTGASGQVEVQFWKVLGAIKVIAVGKPGTKLEKTKELGAAAAIVLLDELEEGDIEAAGNVNMLLG